MNFTQACPDFSAAQRTFSPFFLSQPSEAYTLLSRRTGRPFSFSVEKDLVIMDPDLFYDESPRLLSTLLGLPFSCDDIAFF